MTYGPSHVNQASDRIMNIHSVRSPRAAVTVARYFRAGGGGGGGGGGGMGQCLGFTEPTLGLYDSFRLVLTRRFKAKAVRD